jgi:outer membrane protein OmpA-like peptidoglycan-associated protein
MIVIFRKSGFYFFPLLSIATAIVLTACASSNITREVTANTDQGVLHTKELIHGTGDGSVADSYQNSSQATKGAVLGGTAGAVAGVLSSGVGFIPGTVTGMIFGASYGSYIDANTTLQDQLENRGAIVVILGDHIMIILPAARIFYPNSACIKTQAYATLHILTDYINSYTKMLVKVTGYTNRIGDPKISLALSQQQADNVAKFLLAAGVNARVLYATGLGAHNLIEIDDHTNGESENNRIEITLEKLLV